jgi:hypothetical protein
VPVTDDADMYLTPVALSFRDLSREKGKIPSVETIAASLAFWCSNGWAAHVDRIECLTIARRAQSSPSLKPDGLGLQLRLSDADRTRLNIRTIGSYDVDKKSREQRRRIQKLERDRLRAAERRRALGAIPREQYLAASFSKTKPWESMGISRSTFMRRRKKQRETSPSPIILSIQ